MYNVLILNESKSAEEGLKWLHSGITAKAEN